MEVASKKSILWIILFNLDNPMNKQKEKLIVVVHKVDIGKKQLSQKSPHIVFFICCKIKHKVYFFLIRKEPMLCLKIIKRNNCLK